MSMKVEDLRLMERPIVKQVLVQRVHYKAESSARHTIGLGLEGEVN